VPTANEDAAQLKLTEGFLKSGALTVDIFALSPAQAPLKTGAATHRSWPRHLRWAKKRKPKSLPVRVAKLRRSLLR
jgi:hypothetical protein